ALPHLPAPRSLTNAGNPVLNGPQRPPAFAALPYTPLFRSPDDVRAPVAGDVREKSRVLVDAPATRLLPEVREHHLRRLKGAVAIAARGPHAGVAEADDVGTTVARDIGEKTRIALRPKATGIGSNGQGRPARAAHPTGHAELTRVRLRPLELRP